MQVGGYLSADMAEGSTGAAMAAAGMQLVQGALRGVALPGVPC
jgi:hypothetical protein